MKYILGDPQADHVAFEIVQIDRSVEDENCVIDVFVQSGSYAGDSRMLVNYVDFVLFVYHLGLYVRDEIDLVPELQDRQFGSIIDLDGTLGGIIYDDTSEGAQSLTFDFDIEDQRIHQFVTELKQDHFSHRSRNGLDFDFFLAALIATYPTIRFSVKGIDGFEDCQIGRFPPNWKSKTKPRKTGPIYWFSPESVFPENNTFDTVGQAISAAMIAGRSIYECWDDIEILDINGQEPSDFFDEAFAKLAEL